jgi:hypothetical protein
MPIVSGIPKHYIFWNNLPLGKGKRGESVLYVEAEILIKL